MGNAEEIRDLILTRLREFRESGLGDPDEKAGRVPPLPPVVPEATLAAAQDLLAAARELRSELLR